MPLPVPPWVAATPLSAKSLVLAAYTCDGSLDHPQGIAFNAQRPILCEAYNRTLTLPASSGGTQTVLSSTGATAAGLIVVDSAGYLGMTQDQPIAGYYQFLPAVAGSAGDGATAGGWTLVSHMAAIPHGATQVSVSADLLGTAQPAVTGTRQAASTTQDTTAFFLDLVNAAAGVTWQPAVTIRDSGAANTSTLFTADGSGETCRLCAIWAAVTAAGAGQAVFSVNGTYPFTAPAGVTSITATNTGAGAGGGGGNSTTGGVEKGGGGAGGGELASGSVTVTPGNNYTVIVGAGGAGGTAPTVAAGTPGPGAAGGNSVFTGDAASVTAHGGSGGAGATGTANGSGGAGGTGSTATTHFNGGGGAAGSTALYGGGGGSGAGTFTAGTTAMTAAGAGAPLGAGPGGTGGQETISVVQKVHGWHRDSNQMTLTMKAPFQAGNTVIVYVYYQGSPAAGTGPTPDPDVFLSDGTQLTRQATADVPSAVRIQNSLHDIYGITGGQTGISVQAYGTQNSVKAFLVDVFEVTGLGPSPSMEATADHEQGPASPNNLYFTYTGTEPVTTHAPEFWIAGVGAQQTNSFNIHNPASSQGWGGFGGGSVSNGGIFGVTLTAYQVKPKTGTIGMSGTFSAGVSKGGLQAAYITSAATAGAAPVIGPGGGGGGGLGTSDNGGNGADGQVILTWTGVSGSAYGTPSLPAPYSNWSDATTVGTASSASVNINAGVRDVLNFLANPPVFRTGIGSFSQTIPTGALTAVTPNGGGAADNYTGWSPGTNTYTVQRDGLYLCHGLVSFNASSAGTVRAAGVTVNPGGAGAVTFWGPPGLPTASGTCNVSKTALLDLHAGDTVQLACFQNSGGGLALTTSGNTRLILAWLCELGAPASSWAPPDTTFQWQAATLPTAQAGDLTALLQQHLGNDLGFLVNRPYLLAYQSVTPQTGLTASAFSTVQFGAASGLVWNTPGDSYGGWTSSPPNAYTAQVPGWYLAVGEFFSATTQAAGPAVIAGLQVSSSGGVTPANATDYYQQNAVTNAASWGGGATVFGLIYLNTNETVTPVINGAGYSSTYSTNVGTVAGGAFRSHFGLCWLSNLAGRWTCGRSRAAVLAGHRP